MIENILQVERDQPVASEAPASFADGRLYKLDWDETEIDFGKGRRHTLRRPTAEEIIARDAELQTEVPIGKDGSYQLPDPTANEPVDARLFDKICVRSDGYTDEVPEQHKSAAINGLYGTREIYVDEEFDIASGEWIPVIEEIGGGVTPDYTVTHVLRQPTESELKMYRRKSSAGELKPGKRGRQIFRTTSNLRVAMSFYAQWLVSIDGATVDGRTFNEADRPAWIAAVDPLIQRRVVAEAVDAVTAKLSD